MLPSDGFFTRFLDPNRWTYVPVGQLLDLLVAGNPSVGGPAFRPTNAGFLTPIGFRPINACGLIQSFIGQPRANFMNRDWFAAEPSNNPMNVVVIVLTPCF